MPCRDSLSFKSCPETRYNGPVRTPRVFNPGPKVACLCGCGKRFPAKLLQGGRPRSYYSDTHRKQAKRSLEKLFYWARLMKAEPQRARWIASTDPGLLHLTRRLLGAWSGRMAPDAMRTRTRLIAIEHELAKRVPRGGDVDRYERLMAALRDR